MRISFLKIRYIFVDNLDTHILFIYLDCKSRISKVSSPEIFNLILPFILDVFLWCLIGDHTHNSLMRRRSDGIVTGENISFPPYPSN